MPTRSSSHPGRRSRRRAQILCIALLALAACRDSPPRLLVLLSVDTLRADRLGAYGSDRGLTPRLDGLAAESVVFDAAYAPASFTLPAVAALLTGLHPEALGMWNNHAVLGPAPATLAEELAARGWNTSAVVSNWVLRRASGLDRGFQSFDDTLPQQEATRNLRERTARDTTDALLRALDACLPSEASRCFLWGHYQDPHGPYTPPAGLRRRYLGRERARAGGRHELPVSPNAAGLGGIPNYQYLPDHHEVAFYRAGYDAEVRHVDAEIGRFLDGLEQRGLAEVARIAFVADHGESLGEDDYWFSHGRLLSEPLVRVPLFIKDPHLEPGRRDDVAGLVDLLPTLLARVGESARRPPGGRDLFAPGAEEAGSVVYLAALGGSPEVPRFGLVEGPYKLLLQQVDGRWEEQLYERGRDSVDLAPARRERVAEMRGRLDALRRHHGRQPPAGVQSLSAEERKTLEALGYAE
jgi:arylsulfatase